MVSPSAGRSFDRFEPEDAGRPVLRAAGVSSELLSVAVVGSSISITAAPSQHRFYIVVLSQSLVTPAELKSSYRFDGPSIQLWHLPRLFAFKCAYDVYQLSQYQLAFDMPFVFFDKRIGLERV